MQCEVCGKTLWEKPILVEIEGAVMRVCSNCAKFGKPAKHSAKSETRTYPKKSEQPDFTSKRALQKGSQKNELVPIDNLAEIIRKERQTRNMTQEEFGKLLFEKASIINKIEAGRLVPSNPTLMKIGKKLGINLLISAEEPDERYTTSTNENPIRLGDVVHIKRKKTS